MDLRPNQDRCRYFEGLFSPYIAGGLDEEERRALAEHLHACERCSQQFGLSWRRASARLSKASTTKSTARAKSASNGSRGLWVLAIASLLGVSFLGAMGLLDASEGGGLDPLNRGQKRRMDDEIARMIHVQTTLLESVVEPMRGTRQTVSHAARGHARDFVESLTALGFGAQASSSAAASARDTAAAEELPTKDAREEAKRKIIEFKSVLHPLLRVRDPQPGGRNWNRAEWIEALLRDGAPPVVLVEVVSAYREVLFVRLTWGDRPAFAWLLRSEESEESSADSESSAESADASTAKQELRVPDFQLAFLVFGEA